MLSCCTVWACADKFTCTLYISGLGVGTTALSKKGAECVKYAFDQVPAACICASFTGLGEMARLFGPSVTHTLVRVLA